MTTTVICDKCRGRGHIDVEDSEAPCEATITAGHETISCFASRQHPGQPHMAILSEPCLACGGFDEHAETCDTYLMVPEPPDSSRWWQWADGDLAPVRAAEGAGQAWRNEFQPSSPWASRPVLEQALRAADRASLLAEAQTA